MHIPLGERMVARATSSLDFAGNLDARAGEGDVYSYEYYVFDNRHS